MGLHVWKRVTGLDLITFILPSESNNNNKKIEGGARQLTVTVFWIAAELFLAQRPALPRRPCSTEKKLPLTIGWICLRCRRQRLGWICASGRHLDLCFLGFFFLPPPALGIKINPQALQQDQIFSWTKILYLAFHHRFSSFVYKSVTPVLGTFF